MSPASQNARGSQRKKKGGRRPRRSVRSRSSHPRSSQRSSQKKKQHRLLPPPPLLPLSQITEANPVGKRGNLFAQHLDSAAQQDAQQPSSAASAQRGRYGVRFFTTFQQARSSKNELAESAEGYDQLNVVIVEEGDMQDAELLGVHPHIRLFAGQAWHLIHQRRQQEGWYQDGSGGVLENSAG